MGGRVAPGADRSDGNKRGSLLQRRVVVIQLNRSTPYAWLARFSYDQSNSTLVLAPSIIAVLARMAAGWSRAQVNDSAAPPVGQPGTVTFSTAAPGWQGAHHPTSLTGWASLDSFFAPRDRSFSRAKAGGGELWIVKPSLQPIVRLERRHHEVN